MGNCLTCLKVPSVQLEQTQEASLPFEHGILEKKSEGKIHIFYINQNAIAT